MIWNRLFKRGKPDLPFVFRAKMSRRLASDCHRSEAIRDKIVSLVANDLRQIFIDGPKKKDWLIAVSETKDNVREFKIPTGSGEKEAGSS